MCWKMWPVQIPGDGLICRRQQCRGMCGEVVGHALRTCGDPSLRSRWTWDRPCTLRRVAENLRVVHTVAVVRWNGHKNITGCQKSGRGRERKMRGCQSTDQSRLSIKVPAISIIRRSRWQIC